MAITVKIHNVEVGCESPEEAVAVASLATKFRVPSDEQLAQRINGPIKLINEGTEITL